MPWFFVLDLLSEFNFTYLLLKFAYDAAQIADHVLQRVCVDARHRGGRGKAVVQLVDGAVERAGMDGVMRPKEPDVDNEENNSCFKFLIEKLSEFKIDLT